MPSTVAKPRTKIAPAEIATNPIATAVAQRTASLLKLIGDPTRVRMLVLLGTGELNVGGLCSSIGMSQAVGSHHLAILRVSGVVEFRRIGKNNIYSLTSTGRMLAGMVAKIASTEA